MVRIPSPSNNGGPAARQGFKYQDHAAVSFIFKMLRDSNYLQIECETADDIVAVFQQAGVRVNEYIQVKTTEGNSKWNLTEVMAQDRGRSESSLLQKSLKCDRYPGLARFRMVTKRDVATILECFKPELSSRTLPDDASDRGTKLAKSFKNMVSPAGRCFYYWANNFVWQVSGAMEALAAKNLIKLAELSEMYGNRPNHSQLQDIYEDFLELADRAATADAKTQANEKIILRQPALDLLRSLLDAADTKANATAKPYKSKPEPFLVEFHAATENGLLRSFAAYDVNYDFDGWRCNELAQHLIEWLPEFCLRASEIVNFQAHHAQTVIAKSIGTFNQANLPRDQLIAELILHAILRSQVNSEPIACKVFYKSGATLSEFGNAHVVQQPGQSDQLWLGLSRMISAGAMAQTLAQICEVLDNTISKTALSTERDIIVSLREPHHHLPNAEAFKKAMHRNAPAQEMLKVMCFPILLAYDSKALESGYLSDYIANLKQEIINHYSSLKTQLPKKVDQVKVAVFLVPIESIKALISEFNARCK